MARKAALVAAFFCLACVTLVSAQTCPLTAEDVRKFDFTDVATYCKAPASQVAAFADQEFCGRCVCTITASMVLGLNATGLLPRLTSEISVANGQMAVSDATSKIMESCASTIGLQMVTAAGLDVAAITRLTSCDLANISMFCINEMQKQGLLTPEMAGVSTPATPAPVTTPPTVEKADSAKPATAPATSSSATTPAPAPAPTKSNSAHGMVPSTISGVVAVAASILAISLL